MSAASAVPALTLGGFLRSIWKILSAHPQPPPALEGNQMLHSILHRRSARRFDGRPLPDDVFAAILEAGRLAPSTVNLQTWSYALFTRSSWQVAFGRPIPFKAARALIVMGDVNRSRHLLEALPDSPLVFYTLAVMNASLAAMNMTLAAESLGVASVMLSETGRSGLLDIGYLRDKLGLPEGVFPLMTIAFGYPARGEQPMPPKLPLEEISFSNGKYHPADPAVLQDWLEQMTAGYKASFPFSSLGAQLNVYASKIGEAEKDLNNMVFSSDGRT